MTTNKELELEKSIKRKRRRMHIKAFMNGFCSIIYIFGKIPDLPKINYTDEEVCYMLNQHRRQEGKSDVTFEEYQTIEKMLKIIYKEE